jgi:hypothetical protein
MGDGMGARNLGSIITASHRILNVGVTNLLIEARSNFVWEVYKCGTRVDCLHLMSKVKGPKDREHTAIRFVVIDVVELRTSASIDTDQYVYGKFKNYGI